MNSDTAFQDDSSVQVPMETLYKEMGMGGKKKHSEPLKDQLPGRIDASIETLMEETRRVEGTDAVRQLLAAPLEKVLEGMN